MAASTSSPPPLPCLVLDDCSGSGQPATAFSVSDGAHRAFDAKELRGKRSWPTSSGWVLTWDPSTTATFLWNPSAPTRVALPHPPPPSGSACALSGHPTAGAGGCTVVLVDSAALWYLLAGAAAWTRHEYDVGSVTARFPNGESYSHKRTVSRLAPSCRGRFYYASSSTELGVVDFSPAAAPAFGVVPVNVPLRVPEPEGDTSSWIEAFVYELDIDGDLHMAYVIYHGPDTDNVADVAIYRVDFDDESAVRVDSVGDRAILAGTRLGGGWCPATQFGLVPNSVYWMNPVDKRLHVFDIGARTEKLVQDPYDGVAETPRQQPFWMIPVHP